jgi:NADPH-dependent curcumin reductase CurA
MGEWRKAGLIHPQEAFANGLENTPIAFLGLFSGQNLGKLIVRISPDPVAPVSA